MQVLGKDIPVLTADKTTWTSSSGKVIFKSWQGTADTMQTKYDELQLQQKTGLITCSGIDLDKSKPTATVTVTYIQDAPFQPDLDDGPDNFIWEVGVEIYCKPIEDNKYFKDLTAKQAIEIQNAVAQYEKHDTGYWNTKFSGTIHDDYYEFLIKGNKTFESYGFTVRKTCILANLADRQVANTAIGKIVNLTSIGMPAPVQYMVPTGWEFLKRPASISYQNGKSALTQEFVAAEKWNAKLYTGI